MVEERDDEPVEPEGAEDIPGGSAPGGAQTRPEAQEGTGTPDEIAPEGPPPADDPMLTEPPEGTDGDDE